MIRTCFTSNGSHCRIWCDRRGDSPRHDTTRQSNTVNARRMYVCTVLASQVVLSESLTHSRLTAAADRSRSEWLRAEALTRRAPRSPQPQPRP